MVYMASRFELYLHHCDRHSLAGNDDSLDWSAGADSTSTTISSFSPSCSSGPGTYWAPWGPMLGQYQPKLKPLMKTSPLPQALTLTYVSGKCPVEPLTVLLSTSNVPLQDIIGVYEKSPFPSPTPFPSPRFRCCLLDASRQCQLYKLCGYATNPLPVDNRAILAWAELWALHSHCRLSLVGSKVDH